MPMTYRDGEEDRTCRILLLLLARKQHKQIAHDVGCSETHISNMRYKYINERVTLVLKSEGKRLFLKNQYELPLPKQPRWSEEEKSRKKILRGLGRK
jgi:hypothetical protein